MVQRHRLTQFYTAPTAIRSLMRYGNDVPKKYDLSSLKILGSVGEPINPEAWRWYYENVGQKRCSIVDTYWQTETGALSLLLLYMLLSLFVAVLSVSDPFLCICCLRLSSGMCINAFLHIPTSNASFFWITAYSDYRRTHYHQHPGRYTHETRQLHATHVRH